MRITGGELRSRVVRAPAGERTRPSADKLRQALFNIAGPLAGQWFVDAYAGSGAVGIEAWSRGARPVMWIERHRGAERVLRANLQALAIGGPEAIVRATTVAAALSEAEAMAREAGGPGWVFLDPPYADEPAYASTLAALGTWTLAGMRVAVETRRGLTLPEQTGALRRQRIAVYGDSQLVFFRTAS